MVKKIHIPKSPAGKRSWRWNPQLSNVPCDLQNVLHTYNRFWVIPNKNPQNPKFWCKIYEALPIRRKNNNPVHITQTSERWGATPYSSTGKFWCDQLTTNTTPQHNEEKENYRTQLPTKTDLSSPQQADKGTPGLPKTILSASTRNLWKEVLKRGLVTHQSISKTASLHRVWLWEK